MNNYMDAMMGKTDKYSDDEIDEIDGVDEVDEIEEDEENAELILNEDNNGEVITSRAKAIKAKCLDCCCGQYKEVKHCPATTCPLYPFRLGKDPFRKARTYTDEQREAARKRLVGVHKAKGHKVNEE